MTDERNLDAWLDDAGMAAEWDCEARSETPAFADVVQRARALDPETVPPSWTDLPEAIGPSNRHAERRPDDGVLEPWMDDARDHAEADVHERSLACVPALRRPSRVGWIATATAVAAAAVAIVLLGDLGWTRAEEDTRDGAAPSQAVAKMRGNEARARASSARRPAQADEAFEDDRSSAEAEPPTVEEPGESPTTEEPPTVEERPETSPVPSSSALRRNGKARRGIPAALPLEEERPSLEEELRALDEQAERELIAGRVERADALYAEIIERGGRLDIVELAFSDRFTIAHRRAAEARQQALWRAYLERFPRGRFADDARAGLCRQADDPSDCWRAYLDDFPSGTYRTQARRALSETTP